MKNFKTFYAAQIASRLKKIVRTPTSFLRLWNKNFVTEIYRKCSFWAFRNGALQMFYLTPTRHMFAGKLVKSVRILDVLQSIFFIMLS